MKCPGFDAACDVILTPDTTWTVSGNKPMGAPYREEWQACEDCALAALRWSCVEVYDASGDAVLEEQAS